MLEKVILILLIGFLIINTSIAIINTILTIVLVSFVNEIINITVTYIDKINIFCCNLKPFTNITNQNRLVRIILAKLNDEW